MKNNRKKLRRQDLYIYKKQVVILEDFNIEGFILDIGGGGEGIIGQLKGKQVVAIDSNREELLEAADGPLKIVMDATRLEFLDGTFNMATAFYSLMYMTAEDHRRVFNEVYRVLTKEGVFKIWDVQLTHQGDTDKPGFVIPIEVILPDRKISTGYGSHWPKESYDLSYYIKIAEQTGFKIVEKNQADDSLSLLVRKTSSDN